ncbi:hypothetical protein CKAH01_11942 [Colletotrichum kahawae]|uniref:Uncharacterized protein n=1 Tax=Colletotrichum kahawae TaxID=34407 RepID=A0AAE0DDC8_COLKA|nr:hypothetical protein CKAH01_11942 [Colletotrichum kahawae]
MPPKRRSDASDVSESSKKTKTTPEASPSSESEPPRWAAKSRFTKVSNTRNADRDYKEKMADAKKAFEFICRCPWGTKRNLGGGEQEEEEDDWEDEDEEDGDEDEEEGDGPKPKCDLGKTFIMRAGYYKLMNQQPNVQVRDPDFFGMYTYNDHRAYGIIEIIQNLVLDFDEASANWKEQWVICEALAPFIWYLSGDDFAMCDDGDFASLTAKLVGNLFLSMLARLERMGLLKPDSEVRDLGMVMAGFIKFQGAPFIHVPSNFDSYIAAYAAKYNIKFGGVKGLKSLLDDVQEDVNLPTEKDGEDPWGFKATLKEYRAHRGKIGGDALDITGWSSAERKEAAFGKKDPLPKNILDGLKAGEVIGLA